LRDRKEDVPELVRFFLRKYARELGVTNPSIQTEAIELLQNHRWSGNVRELEILCANSCCSRVVTRLRGARPRTSGSGDGERDRDAALAERRRE